MWPFKFPYTNFHELNLDWIIDIMKSNSTRIDTLEKFDTKAEIENALKKAAEDGTLANSLEGVIFGSKSVKTFGAVGDGVTDDTQAFIDSLAEQNFVFLTPGKYKITRPLSLESGQCIYGVSPYLCTIEGIFNDGIIKSAGWPDEQKKNIVIRNLSITGDNSYSYPSNNGVMLRCAGVNLEDVYVFSVGGRGFFLQGNGDLTGRDTRIEGSLTRCTAIGCGYSGLFLEGPNDSTILDCHFISNGQQENSAAAGAANCYLKTSAKVIGCHFWNFSSGSGYRRPPNGVIVNAATVEFTSCDIEGSGAQNLYNLNGNVNVSNCKIYAPGPDSLTLISNQAGTMNISNSTITGGSSVYAAITDREGHLSLCNTTINAQRGIDSTSAVVLWVGSYKGGEIPYLGSAKFVTFLTGQFNNSVYPKFNPPT